MFLSTLLTCNGVDTTGNLAGTWLSSSGIGTTKLDISAVNRDAYIYFRKTWAGNLNVYKVWLEK